MESHCTAVVASDGCVSTEESRRLIGCMVESLAKEQLVIGDEIANALGRLVRWLSRVFGS